MVPPGGEAGGAAPAQLGRGPILPAENKAHVNLLALPLLSRLNLKEVDLWLSGLVEFPQMVGRK